jgi:hypothetical protein
MSLEINGAGGVVTDPTLAEASPVRSKLETKVDSLAQQTLSKAPETPPRKLASSRVKVMVDTAKAQGSTGAGATFKKAGLGVLAIALGTVASILKVLESPIKLFAMVAGKGSEYEGLGTKLFRGVAHLRRQIAIINGSQAVKGAFAAASSAASKLNAREALTREAAGVHEGAKEKAAAARLKAREKAEAMGLERVPAAHTGELAKAKEGTTGTGLEGVHVTSASELAKKNPKLAAFVLARGELEATARALREVTREEKSFSSNLGRIDVAQVPADLETHTTKEMMKSRVKAYSKDEHFKEAFKEEALSAMNADTGLSSLTALAELGPEGQSWRAYSGHIEGESVTAVADSVCPTSSRTKYEVAGLHNAYVNVVTIGGRPQLNITTGVIDTKAKADAFIAIIRQAVAEHPEVAAPLRINMHQLNSFIAEEGLIECEHAMSLYIQQQLRSGDTARDIPALTGAVVTHENTSFNAATKYPVREEAKCNAMNTEAAAAQLLSMAGELGISQDSQRILQNALDQVQSAYSDAVSYDPSDYPQLGSLSRDIENLKGELQGAFESLGALELDSEAYREKADEMEQLKADIRVLEQTQALAEQSIIAERIGVMSAPSHARDKLSAELDRLRYELGEKKAAAKEALSDRITDARERKYALLATLHAKLGIVTGKAKMSQAAKVVIQHLADVSMGAVSQANCKSGLDRTGMARALFATVDKMLMDGVLIDEVVDFALNLDQYTKQVNDMLERKFGSNPPTSPAELDAAFEGAGEEMKRLRAAFDFQTHNFANLMQVGLPITARSTGLAGAKWHHEGGMSANPHPGPMLPRFVIDSRGTVQRAVEANGILSPYGVRVISGASALRGG